MEERKMPRLEVITGPMFCGKTDELIRRLRTAGYADKKILVIKPVLDSRSGQEIASRIKNPETNRFEKAASLPAQPVASQGDFWKLNNQVRYDIIAVDEAQFFGPWFPPVVSELFDGNQRDDLEVIIAGLDMDAWRRPFGNMPTFMAMADSVAKLKAVCFKCKRPEAIFTQKLGGSGSQIEIGDTELYEARCRKCHSIPLSRS